MHWLFRPKIADGTRTVLRPGGVTLKEMIATDLIR